jgi:hypothetical protein
LSFKLKRTLCGDLRCAAPDVEDDAGRRKGR